MDLHIQSPVECRGMQLILRLVEVKQEDVVVEELTRSVYEGRSSGKGKDDLQTRTMCFL